LRALDGLLGGLHKSDLVILAARPSMGKSALASNIAFAAARAHRREAGPDGQMHTVDGASVGFFSLEMSAQQITTRILAEQAGVPSERIRRGKLTSTEMDRLIDVTAGLQNLPLHVDDTPALSISALRSRARRMKRQRGLDLVVVDYLQMVDASNRKDGRVQEVSEVSRGLKALAKELEVPVLALSQLSRNVENRSDKRPQLSDLRDSGTIEQDADVVMFIYREEYYLERGTDADRARIGDVAGKAEVLIAKQRHGPTGVAHLRFDAPTTCFADDPDFLADARLAA
jgi:replicative DNA helicase